MKRELIEGWIADHEEEFLADLGKLIGIRSVSQPGTAGAHPFGDPCAEVLDVALAMAEGYGLKTANQDYYYGEVTYGEGKESLGFAVHLDVVPEGEGWDHPPYSLTREGDLLFGRGVEDDKGPALLAMYALRCLKELGYLPHHRMRVFLGCSEETGGMSDIVHLKEVGEEFRFVLVPDAEFPLCNGEKGILEAWLSIPCGRLQLSSGTVSNVLPDRAELFLPGIADDDFPEAEGITLSKGDTGLAVTATGITAHASRPADGIDALLRLANYAGQLSLPEEEKKAMAFLKQLIEGHDGSGIGIACEDEPSGALTLISGIVKTEEGRMLVNVNIRYPSTADGDGVADGLRTGVAAAGGQVDSLDNSPGYYIPAEDPAIAAVMEVYTEETGSPAGTYRMGGGTYARMLKNAAAFGPCFPDEDKGLPLGKGGCHQPDEAIPLSWMRKALMIYIRALCRLDACLSD